MKDYLKLGNVRACLFIDKKEYKKDLKKEFIKRLSIKHLEIFNNPKIKSELEKISEYKLSADNGYFSIFGEYPFHAHIEFSPTNEKELENFTEFISDIGDLLEEISTQKVKSINFSMTFIFLIKDKIELHNILKIKDMTNFKTENKLKNLEIAGIDFLIKDEGNRSYKIEISNVEKEVELIIGGHLISKKKEGVLKLYELYELLYGKINKLLVYINEV